VGIPRPGFSIITDDTPVESSAQAIIQSAVAAESVDLNCEDTENLIVTHLISQRYVAISSISVSTNVVTVVTAADHGFTSLDEVVISDVLPTDFNGTYVATVSDETTFTYALTLGDTTGTGGRAHVAAAGYVTLYQLLQNEITNVTKVLDTVTITTRLPHCLSAGETIAIEGVTPTSYNGSYEVVSVPTSTTFTYEI